MSGRTFGRCQPVVCSNNYGNGIEYSVISRNLFIEPGKGVPFAFYFVSDEATIDHSNICPARAVHQSELIKYSNVFYVVIAPELLLVKIGPYFDVIHNAQGQ
jgi:hypothetical protein